MGKWMMEVSCFNSVKAMMLAKPLSFSDDVDFEAPTIRKQITHDGIMIMDIQGMMMRSASSFGGTSTVEARQILRDAIHDDEIRGVVLNMDSGGGTVDGTDALAEDVKRADQ